jgi:hypothetical protein
VGGAASLPASEGAASPALSVCPILFGLALFEKAKRDFLE